MTRRAALLTISAIGWVGFAGVATRLAAFLAAGVDGSLRVSPPVAVLNDLGLFVLFGAQHSIMARSSVKAKLGRWLLPELERTVYVMMTVVCLGALITLWQPLGGSVWHVEGVAAGLLWGLFLGGCILAVASTFAVDHLELTGLRQAGWSIPAPAAASRLRTGGLHAIVRHPLMTGMLVAFWATPDLGWGHLMFASAASAYVVVGIRFEEGDLRRRFGPAYDAYAAAVPALLPIRLRRRKVADDPVDLR